MQDVSNFVQKEVIPIAKTGLEVYNVAKLLAPLVGLGKKKKIKR